MSKSAFKDTIYALSTGWGKSAIAVIRVSGPSAQQALSLTLNPKEIHPRVAHYRTLYDMQRQPIDRGLLLYFNNPKSFTGEDMVEFHIHGGVAVKSRLLETLSKFETFREALPVRITFSSLSHLIVRCNRVNSQGALFSTANLTCFKPKL